MYEFDYAIVLVGFRRIFILKIQRLKFEGKPTDLQILIEIHNKFYKDF